MTKNIDPRFAQHTTDELLQVFNDTFKKNVKKGSYTRGQMIAKLEAHFQVDQEEETETVTEVPVENVADANEEDVQAKIEEDNAAEEETQAQEEFALDGKPNGKTMQAIARDWTGTRKAFLELVVGAGANANSAAWHWHQGRK